MNARVCVEERFKSQKTARRCSSLFVCSITRVAARCMVARTRCVFEACPRRMVRIHRAIHTQDIGSSEACARVSACPFMHSL